MTIDNNNNAIIRIEGAMIKKHTIISAKCGGFTSYEEIEKHLISAENNPLVKRIILRVDTVGGDVSGVDNIGELIYNSKKETITYYENYGCSAGIWAFSASDKLYASELAFLGSIGVMSTYRDRGTDEDAVVIVSKNAKNKNCSLNGDCKTKITNQINDLEDLFHSRVSRNTGLSRDEIVEYFNKGDIVMSKDALGFGFLNKIDSFDTILSNLNNEESNMADDKTSKSVKSVEVLTAEIGLATNKIETLTADLKAKDEVIKNLESKSNDSVNMSAIENIVSMAFEYGANKDQAIKMLSMNEGEAGLFLLKSKTDASEGATTSMSQLDGNKEEEKASTDEKEYVSNESIETIIAMANEGVM
jgi:ClpP class serine protease